MTTRLVSFLGLGPEKGKPPYYTETVYELDGKSAQKTPLMEAALCELLPIDSVITLGTREVKARWFDSDLVYSYLAQPKPHFVPVPTPKTTRDMWEVFLRTIDMLSIDPIEKSDETVAPTEIIVDVTHGFRAQPLLAMAAVGHVLSEWARQKIKEPPTLQILYGAFEPKRPEHTPIWDLTGFVLATRWNAALDAFMRFGRADDLERLSAQYSQSKRNEIRETDKHPGSYAAANVASRLGDAAKQFADDLAFGRLLNILKGEKKTGSAQHLINVLESEEIASFKDEFPPVLSTLSDLRSRLDPFVAATLHESDGLRASVRLAEYYGRIQRFAEQASLLWETLVSAIAPKLDLDLIEPGNKGSRVTREQASRALTALTQKLRKPETREEIPDKIFKEVELANQIGELRNDIEHCGLRDHPGRAKDLYKNLKTYMHKVSDLIVPMEPGKTRKAPSSEDTQPLPCFINLSNHPLIAWSDDQREGAEALGFGEPIDLEGGMPLVDPKATTEDIERLAHDLADKALRQGAQGAFVAGEFTLTQALVAILQSWSIHCYSATTEREAILEEKEDGSTERRSIFRFVAWREYPAI